jgi:hypothetical protein
MGRIRLLAAKSYPIGLTEVLIQGVSHLMALAGWEKRTEALQRMLVDANLRLRVVEQQQHDYYRVVPNKEAMLEPQPEWFKDLRTPLVRYDVTVGGGWTDRTGISVHRTDHRAKIKRDAEEQDKEEFLRQNMGPRTHQQVRGALRGTAGLPEERRSGDIDDVVEETKCVFQMLRDVGGVDIALSKAEGTSRALKAPYLFRMYSLLSVITCTAVEMQWGGDECDTVLVLRICSIIFDVHQQARAIKEMNK